MAGVGFPHTGSGFPSQRQETAFMAVSAYLRAAGSNDDKQLG